VILVDTSAWVHFLRGTEHPARFAVRNVLAHRGGDVAVTEPVMMELLAGARTDAEAARLRSTLLALEFLPVHGLVDYEEGAAIHRSCRKAGETVRSVLDCLIAAVAIRSGASLLHADVDFEVIARHTPLRLEPPAT
jgi:predicted nucleic acid-binding protein